MAAASRSARTTELQTRNKWKDSDTISPDRTVVWTEPLNKSAPKVPVVYYLSSSNGQLQHPHFIQVPLSSPHGLHLRDVINRLNFLRGKGMASMYSWSCKRSYKNGYVWHDLEENDFIYPVHGQEYVLKGTELFEGALISKADETVASSSSKKSLPESTGIYGRELDLPAVTRRRHQSWSSFDLREYNVYKTESTGETAGQAAANASTQTDDKRRRRRAVRVVEETEEEAAAAEEEQKREEKNKEAEVIHSTELSKGEISPPPSDSSPETLETLLKADGRLMILRSEPVNKDLTAINHLSGKPKVTSILMQLLSCGSMSFKDCGPGKEHGFSLLSHYKTRLPRGEEGSNNNNNNPVEKDTANVMVENMKRNSSSSSKVVVLEDKEYFSGSLIETKKTEFPALKRSSSYNVDRTSRMELIEKEIEGVKARCIPRMPKAHSTRKEVNNDHSCNNTSVSCSSQDCSKEVVVQQ